MATYKAYLFNMVTDNGSCIEITGKHGALETIVTFKGNTVDITFSSIDVLQNFISANTDKSLTNEQIVNKLTSILYKLYKDYNHE